MSIAERIIAFNKSLSPPSGLPKEVGVLNPYKDEQALTVSSIFYNKFYSDENQRIALFGINPGRFGGGITGIPFTDPIKLTEKLDLEHSFALRAELSSNFMYEMIEAYGGADRFYASFYFTALSPLGYVKEDKNLNYYDIPNWKPIFETYANEQIVNQLKFPLNTNFAICIGQGQNLKFLESLNQKHHYFNEIKVVPHPRWIMQYRLKRKSEFIDQYLQTLSDVN
ncbi:MAG: hypothetical protein ACJAVY_001631 [Marinoscillum sp.]|jgi:hypothetical protein